jgi:hypothetical protein
MKISLFMLVPVVLFFILALCALFARRRFKTSLKIPFALFSFEADDQNDGPPNP